MNLMPVLLGLGLLVVVVSIFLFGSSVICSPWLPIGCFVEFRPGLVGARIVGVGVVGAGVVGVGVVGAGVVGAGVVVTTFSLVVVVDVVTGRSSFFFGHLWLKNQKAIL